MNLDSFCVKDIVYTQINVDRLEQELSHHPDRQFVYYFLNGIRNGFDAGISSLPQTSFDATIYVQLLMNLK